MRTVVVLREVAPDDWANGQDVEIVGRDSSRMQVLHPRPGLEIDPRRSGTRNRRYQRGDMVAQQLPLLTVQVVPLIGGRRAGHSGVDGTHALRL